MSLGITELVLIAVIVLVMFGAGRLPRIMGDIGTGIRQFKQGLSQEKQPPSVTQTPNDPNQG